MLDGLRGGIGRVFRPIAKGLLRMGVSPDAVTIIGALGTIAAALYFFSTGKFLVGALVVAALALFDALDGTMARLSGKSGPWGAFLDSTLDRFADAAIFGGIAVFYLITEPHVLTGYLAIVCLVLGFGVSYARARAEGLGFTAAVGIAERADRLAAVLVAAALVGVGLPHAVMTVVLGLLAVASVITVLQRMVVVRRQALALPTEGSANPAEGSANPAERAEQS